MIRFFYGKNSFLIDQALKKVESDFAKLDSAGINLEKIDGSNATVARIQQAIATMPFLAEKRLLIVSNLLLENKDSEIKSQLCDFLQQHSQKQHSYIDVIFVEYGEPDKRGKLYKFLQQKTDSQEFRNLEGPELVRFVGKLFAEEGIEAKNQECQYLIMQAGNEMQKLSHEVEKLSLYVRSQSRASLEKSDIDQLVAAEVDPNVFAFTEAIARRDAKSASRLLSELLYKGENEQKLIGNIAYQFRTLLIIKDCLDRGIDSALIAQKAKLAPFVVSKNLAIAQKKSMKTLIAMYDSLRRTDSTIKSGSISPDLAINILVATLCGGK